MVDRWPLAARMRFADEIQELPDRDALHLVANVGAPHERLEKGRALEKIFAKHIPRRRAHGGTIKIPCKGCESTTRCGGEYLHVFSAFQGIDRPRAGVAAMGQE